MLIEYVTGDRIHVCDLSQARMEIALNYPYACFSVDADIVDATVLLRFDIFETSTKWAVVIALVLLRQSS